MTPEEIEIEYWAHEFAERGIQDEIEDENFDDNLDAMERQLSQNTSADEFEEVINDKRN